jgi:hypothetical protein
MPYISFNGQLFEITQAQYDSYTIGSPLPSGAVLTNAATVAAGGTVTNNNSTTTPILTENTTNNSPNQTLTNTSTAVITAATTANIIDPYIRARLGLPANEVDTAPAEVSSVVDPQASLAAGETVVPADQVNSNNTVSEADSGFVQQADGSFVSAADAPVDPATDPTAGGGFVQQADGSFVATDDVPITDINGEATSPTEDPNTPEEVSATTTETNTGADTTATDDPYAVQDQENGANAGTGTSNTGIGTSADGDSATAGIRGLVNNAQQQQTIADQRKQINNGDWRVRLRLAPQSNYLYNAQNPGIMQPLRVTDGIIFPYTPSIDTSYRANYESYDLTHSNYRGYFYKNSYVDAISLKAQFTAQDTNEANYLLAVITFLKSATKMFYGQDTQRGAPPPLVYLSGFGDYQFREHACVISQFQYNLPDNIDYIRAGSPNNVGLNLTSIRDRQSVATNSIFGSINRLAAAFLPKGGTTGAAAPPTLGLNRPTYVPTKIDINLTLFPMQSRQQVSKQFSLKEFANGNLIKGGFW